MPAWIEATADLAPPEVLMAVGAVSIAYNDLEFALYGLLDCFIPEGAVPALYYELHNSGRASAITALARERLDAEQQEAVAHGLRGFAICTENRNLIAHAMGEWLRHLDGAHVVFIKAVRGRRGDVAEYILSADDVGEAACRMMEFSDYIYAVVRSLNSSLHAAEGEAVEDLPTKPALPQSLSIHRRSDGPPD